MPRILISNTLIPLQSFSRTYRCETLRGRGGTLHVIPSLLTIGPSCTESMPFEIPHHARVTIGERRRRPNNINTCHISIFRPYWLGTAADQVDSTAEMDWFRPHMLKVCCQCSHRTAFLALASEGICTFWDSSVAKGVGFPVAKALGCKRTPKSQLLTGTLMTLS